MIISHKATKQISKLYSAFAISWLHHSPATNPSKKKLYGQEETAIHNFRHCKTPSNIQLLIYITIHNPK